MTEQNTTGQEWIEQEKAELGTPTETIFEKLPALKFQENKITEITVDFSKKFDTYDTVDMKQNPVKKAIIPVLHEGQRKNWWLNKKNPIYRELLELGKVSKTVIVKIVQTGTQQNTKYAILK